MHNHDLVACRLLAMQISMTVRPIHVRTVGHASITLATTRATVLMAMLELNAPAQSVSLFRFSAPSSRD